MKYINDYITEKLHLTKANKDNLVDAPSNNIAKAIENSVFMKYTNNEVNEDISRELLRWVTENNVEEYHGYSNNNKYENISKFGSIIFDKNMVNIYIDRLCKTSTLNRYSSKTVTIICNEILRKSDTPTLYIALKDVDFVILKH